MAKPGRPRAPKREGWGKEAVLAGLREGKAIMDVCAEYSIKSPPRVLYKETADWRKSDPAFAAEYDAVLNERFPNRSRAGRPRKETLDPLLADWRLKFCEDLFATANRARAADNSPFEYPHILAMLDPNKAEYDKDFADMVHEVELRICSEMEGGIWSAYKEASGRDKAWIARQWLERRSPERWASQSKLQVSGKVEHEHKGVLKVELSRDERLALLAADQEKYFQAYTPKALPEGEVVEAEVVEPSQT